MATSLPTWPRGRGKGKGKRKGNKGTSEEETLTRLERAGRPGRYRRRVPKLPPSQASRWDTDAGRRKVELHGTKRRGRTTTVRRGWDDPGVCYWTSWKESRKQFQPLPSALQQKPPRLAKEFKKVRFEIPDVEPPGPPPPPRETQVTTEGPPMEPAMWLHPLMETQPPTGIQNADPPPTQAPPGPPV